MPNWRPSCGQPIRQIDARLFSRSERERGEVTSESALVALRGKRWPPLRVFSIATICRPSLGTNGNSQALAYVARALPDPSLVTGSGSRAPAEITPPSGPLQSAIPNLLAPASRAAARQAGTQGARAIVQAITITSDCCGFRRSGSRRLAKAASPIATVAICSAPSKKEHPNNRRAAAWVPARRAGPCNYRHAARPSIFRPAVPCRSVVLVHSMTRVHQLRDGPRSRHGDSSEQARRVPGRR
jgi:hypothetical protein